MEPATGSAKDTKPKSISLCGAAMGEGKFFCRSVVVQVNVRKPTTPETWQGYIARASKLLSYDSEREVWIRWGEFKHFLLQSP